MSGLLAGCTALPESVKDALDLIYLGEWDQSSPSEKVLAEERARRRAEELSKMSAAQMRQEGAVDARVQANAERVKADRLATLRDKATAGDATAQAQLAEKLLIGDGVEPTAATTEEALQWLEKSAATGNLEGVVGLAERDILGDRSPEDAPDYAKAWPVINQAADAGHPRALFWRSQYRLLGLAGQKVDKSKALADLKAAAQDGLQAGFWPAKVLLVPHWSPEEQGYFNFYDELPWLSHVARHGFPTIATAIGTFYEAPGHYRDMKKALDFYTIGSRPGQGGVAADPAAQVALAKLYLVGVPEIRLASDVPRAFQLYSAAASAGALPAKVYVTLLNLIGQGDRHITTVEAEGQLASYCTSGEPYACELLGDAFAQGKFTFTPNTAKARQYYQLGCQRGSLASCQKQSP